MFRITKEFHFSASHQLTHLPPITNAPGCTGTTMSWWWSWRPKS